MINDLKLAPFGSDPKICPGADPKNCCHNHSGWNYLYFGELCSLSLTIL